MQYLFIWRNFQCVCVCVFLYELYRTLLNLREKNSLQNKQKIIYGCYIVTECVCMCVDLIVLLQILFVVIVSHCCSAVVEREEHRFDATEVYSWLLFTRKTGKDCVSAIFLHFNSQNCHISLFHNRFLKNCAVLLLMLLCALGVSTVTFLLCKSTS